MADIAFLLLIFFLVTTTIKDDKGLMMQLPPKVKDVAKIHNRNILTLKINSNDEVMAEEQVVHDIGSIKTQLIEFILNPQSKVTLSETPDKAIISIKTNRGTFYRRYIEVLDIVQAAYYDIYAKRVSMTSPEFRNLNLQDPSDKILYDQARSGIPMNISIAEPTN